MGPPKALLGQDQWSIGLEYARQSVDLESFGTVKDILVNVPPFPFVTVEDGEHKIQDLESNVVLCQVGYGLSGGWDVFLRLGAADAEDDIERNYPDGATDLYEGFDGSFGFAWGLGTRATFWQDGDVSWGGLVQVTWLEPDDSDIGLSGDTNFSGNAEIDFWELQIAVGPTVQMDDNFRIYGGPFLHFVDGDLELSGQTDDAGTQIRVEASGDIEEESQFGGFAGAHWDMNENTACYIEGQLTADAWSIGIGAARRF
jgi:hypothetical protein